MEIVKTHRDLPENAIILSKALKQAKEDGLGNKITYDRFVGSTPPLRKWIYRVDGGRDMYVVYEELSSSILGDEEALSVLSCVKDYIDKTGVITFSKLRKESGGLFVYRKPYVVSYKRLQEGVEWLNKNYKELVEEAVSDKSCRKDR